MNAAQQLVRVMGSEVSMKSRSRFFSLLLFAFILSTCAATSSGERRLGHAPRAVVPQWDHEWARGGTFYEVFVRSFCDSNGDGIGDLPGLISKLDYLNDGNPETDTDLGVDALWLMPIFASPSYHGYDTTDYATVNPEYGTNDDFVRLCQEAHARGIRIILDFVINHTGSDHPWFIDSASSPSSTRRNWYVWAPVDLGWRQPWGGDYSTWHPKNGAYYYGLFWSGMPDLNLRTPAVRNTIEQIGTLWLTRGADGFRLDASRYLIETGGGPGQADTPETHAFWRDFSLHVRTAKPEATLVGENWTDTAIIATYYGSTTAVVEGDELPMNFDFPLASEIVDGVGLGEATAIAKTLADVKALYPAGATDAPFLTNHDMTRLATQLGNDAGKLRTAAAVLLTLPGSPFLYYGEEAGLQNGPTPGDESKRTPMPWNASEAGGGFTTGTPWFPFAPGRDTANISDEQASTDSLLARYRALIKVRGLTPALRQGDIELLTPTTGTYPVLAFVRSTGAERVLAVHNLSGSFVVGGPFNVTANGFDRVWGDPIAGDPSGTSGSWRVMLAPHASGIWRAR